MTHKFLILIQFVCLLSTISLKESEALEKWIAIRRPAEAPSSPEKESSRNFLDLDGCSKEGEPVTNYFLQSRVLDASVCTRTINNVFISYTADNKKRDAKVNVSLVMVPTGSVNGFSAQKLTWEYVRKYAHVLNYTFVEKEGSFYFGGVNYMTRAQHFLALAVQNSCGLLSVYQDLEANPEQCTGGIFSLAQFPTSCKDQNTPRKIEHGYCVEHSVQVTTEKPSASCYQQSPDFIAPHDQCQCKPGYFASKAATSCERCPQGYFKSDVGNHECKPCPGNSQPSVGNTECFCHLGFFWTKGKAMTDPCVPVNLPKKNQYNIKADYTWLNVSLQHVGPDANYVMEVLKYGGDQKLFASEPLNSNRPSVFIKGLQPRSRFQVYLCDNRNLEFNHGIAGSPGVIREHRCSPPITITTADEVTVSNLSIAVTGSGQAAMLAVNWCSSKAVLGDYSGRISYFLEIFHNDVSLIRTPLKSQVYNYEYPVSSPGFYHVELSLFANRAKVYSLKSENIAVDNSTEMNEAISTVLIAVVGMILVLLFIVFLLAVIFLRARRDIYPPSRPVVAPPKYVSTMFEFDSQNNMTLPFCDKWNSMNYQSYQSAAQGRYLEPETELMPHFQSQNQTIFDLLAFLGVVSLPYSEIEADKMDTHFTFLKGQIGVSKVKLKNGPDREQQMDLKIPRVDDPEINHALLLEAATLTQLKHNHVALLHGIVDFGTSEPMVALLMEDCGSTTLLQYIRSAGTNHVPGIQEKLMHLRCVASALEHFQHVEYVHKVLCASNVVINPNRVCRIVGFEDRVHFNKAPAEVHMKYVRFWAPEVIKNKAFSYASDMWSFGVLIWQCFNVTSNPFQQYTDAQVEKLVIEGHCLPPNPSDTMPPKLSDVMRICFSYNTLSRPTAYDVKEIIQSIVFSSKGQEMKYEWNSIFPFLSRLGLQQYVPLLEMSGFYRLEDIQWEKAEELFKGMGIPKQHRRLILNEGHKTLIDNHAISAV